MTHSTKRQTYFSSYPGLFSVGHLGWPGRVSKDKPGKEVFKGFLYLKLQLENFPLYMRWKVPSLRLERNQKCQ